MNSRILTVVFTVAILICALLLAPRIAAFRLPGRQTNYEPNQPIAYSHRLHAGELQIQCLYCHFGAQTSKHAGIPPANVCMNCHKFVTALLGAIKAEDELAAKEKRPPRRIISSELQKLYDALALDEKMQPDPAKTPKPIAWIKIHNLPDHVYFDHRAHFNAGVVCQQCHGAIETMERVRQVEKLNMGWCVNCHRDVNKSGVGGKAVHASIDCSTCHY